MSENLFETLQSLIAWALLIFLSLFVLFEGGNQPLAWMLAAILVFVLFALQVVLDLLAQRPETLNKLWLPGLLFLLAVGWGVAQRMPDLPATWTHPVWALELPETIGFDDLEAGAGDDVSEEAVTSLSEEVAEDPAPRAVVSADPEQGRHVVLRLLTYAMVFWIALRAAGEMQRASRLLGGFALFSTCLAAFGLYAFATGNNPILGEAASPVVSASFVNRNNYATFAVFGALANLAVFLRASNSAELGRANPIIGFIEGFFAGAWLWLLGFILCIGAVLLTQSRAGVVTALIGVTVFVTAQRRRNSMSSFGPLGVILLVVLFLIVTASAGVLERFVTASGDPRFTIYPAIVEAIMDRPWLGHGLGSFHDVFRIYVPLESAFGAWDLAHNSYLENAFEFGLPAAALFYLALILLGLRLLRGLSRRQRARNMLAFVFACYCAAAFHALFDFSLQMPALAAFFAWILGLGYAQSFSAEDISAAKSKAQNHKRTEK